MAKSGTSHRLAPDESAGGYGAVLVEVGEGGSVRIFVPEDLPRTYDVIGRLRWCGWLKANSAW
jgi:hypothetical protein